MPNRKRALRSANEEFKRIFDVVAKYAVFCTGARRNAASFLVWSNSSSTTLSGATSVAALYAAIRC